MFFSHITQGHSRCISVFKRVVNHSEKRLVIRAARDELKQQTCGSGCQNMENRQKKRKSDQPFEVDNDSSLNTSFTKKTKQKDVDSLVTLKIEKRKNIRSVKGKESCVEESKVAQQQETERLGRIKSQHQSIVLSKLNVAQGSGSTSSTSLVNHNSDAKNDSSEEEELPCCSSPTPGPSSLDDGIQCVLEI